MSQYEAERMTKIPFSSIRTVFEQVAVMESQGQDVVAFHIGRPDFDTPAHVKAAAQQALDAGQVTYTSNYGLLELRRAIADKLAQDNGIVADPETEIIVTVGANEAVFIAMMGLLNPGDEVLVPDPMWLHYQYCARLAGARVTSVPLRESNGFQLDPDDLEHRVTDRTRMIVLNSPHNPTGVVFRREVIDAVADIARRHDLVLVSDEIYEQILYDDAKHVSPASMPQAGDRTITINGFSKAYAMTGWRLGYLVAPADIIDVLIRVHQYTTICATSFAQAGAVAALNGPQACVAEMVDEFDRRRRHIVETFDDMPDVSLVTPTGAFYAFPNVSALGGTSEDLARTLLREAGVAVVPGSAFGAHGEGYVRIAYSCSLPDVRQGMAAVRNHWRQTLPPQY